MSNEKATARPWHGAKNDVTMIIGADQARVADCSVSIGMAREEMEANARLIWTAVNEREALLAEVGRLREALTTLRHHLQKQPDVVRLIDAALSGKVGEGNDVS